MRFMIIIKATKDTEAGVMPDEKLLSDMGKFNEQLVNAGVMLAGEGLQPSSKGARVKFSGSRRTVIDGPFAETKELIAGYLLLEARSMDEAVAWAKKWPALDANVRNQPLKNTIEIIRHHCGFRWRRFFGCGPIEIDQPLLQIGNAPVWLAA